MRRLYYALFFPILFLCLLWGIWGIEQWLDISFRFLGTTPRTIEGLPGAFTHQLVHANIKHLFNNSLPLLLLGGFLFYFYGDIAFGALFWMWLGSSLLTWTIGRPALHIGASGIVYALVFFLFFSGVLRRHTVLMRVSLAVTFIYGGLIWNMFPIATLLDASISWEGHLSGAITGTLVAIIYRKKGVQNPLSYDEQEDEDDTPPDQRYWELPNEDESISSNIARHIGH